MNSVSNNFVTLTSVECSPGTMFISLAALDKACASGASPCCFFWCLSGNMNVFFDSSPVSSKASHPPLGLLQMLLQYPGFPSFVVAIIALSMLIVESVSSVSSCSLT